MCTLFRCFSLLAIQLSDIADDAELSGFWRFLYFTHFLNFHRTFTAETQTLFTGVLNFWKSVGTKYQAIPLIPLIMGWHTVQQGVFLWARSSGQKCVGDPSVKPQFNKGWKIFLKLLLLVFILNCNMYILTVAVIHVVDVLGQRDIHIKQRTPFSTDVFHRSVEEEEDVRGHPITAKNLSHQHRHIVFLMQRSAARRRRFRYFHFVCVCVWETIPPQSLFIFCKEAASDQASARSRFLPSISPND